MRLSRSIRSRRETSGSLLSSIYVSIAMSYRSGSMCLTPAAQGGQSPSLWGFILAILGSILVLSTILLIFYQFLRRRRRRDLRRRIEAGQVDLESLGFGRTRVPREVLAKMPVYIYPDVPSSSSSVNAEAETPEAHPDEGGQQIPTDNGTQNDGNSPLNTHDSHGGNANDTSTPPSSAEEEKVCTPESPPPALPALPAPALFPTATATAAPNTNPNPNPTSDPSTSNPEFSNNSRNRLSAAQPTCAICLDDFVPQFSQVRELPCGHIFHSECIDGFLVQNSCLCPLCKKSVLVTTDAPVIVSNGMVRRETAMRRIRGG